MCEKNTAPRQHSIEKAKKLHPNSGMAVIEDEIFSSIEDYALEGAEDEYKPTKQK